MNFTLKGFIISTKQIQYKTPQNISECLNDNELDNQIDLATTTHLLQMDHVR